MRAVVWLAVEAGLGAEAAGGAIAAGAGGFCPNLANLS
jgi:hypothetical protein